MATWGGYNQETIEANRFGNVYIVDYLDLSGRLVVQNSGDISLNRLFVINDASFGSNVYVAGNLTTNLKFTANVDVSLNNRLFIQNDASLNSNVYVNGNITYLKFTVNSDGSFNNRLFVQNDASLNANVYVGRNLTTNLRLITTNDICLNSNVIVGKDISCNGNITIGKDLIVGGNLAVKNYTAQNIINTTTTNYQFVVSEDLSLNGRLSVSSDSSCNGSVQINGNLAIKSTNPVGLLDICGSMVRTTFAATGNIGIGTTTPTCPLHVITSGSTDPRYNGVVIECTNNASTTADSIMSLRTAQSGGNPYVSYDIKNRAGWSMGMDNADNNFKLAHSYNTLTSNTRMTLATTGFIGVGTTWNYVPQSYFQVYGNTLASATANADTGTNHHLVITSTPAGTQPSTPYSMALGYDVSNNIGYINARGNSTSMPICFQTRGNNLGIGLTNPTAELHVNGSVKINNTQAINGILTGYIGGSTGTLTGVTGEGGTVLFGTTFTNPPTVFTSLNSGVANQVFGMEIYSTTTTGFTWRKYWVPTSSSANYGGGPASAEAFWWMAIGV
jgi:acetyltransferase-like isoleucine patch superfamily enzyme